MTTPRIAGVPMNWYKKQREQIQQLQAIIQRIRDLHCRNGERCLEDGATYPCPTIRALDGEQE